MDARVMGEMASLGLAAFDPVGVAAMPILLSQPRGVARAWTFLFGSTVALMALGIGVARGLGEPLLRFTREHTWLDPAIELVAGVVLLGLAAYFLLRVWRQHTSGSSEQLVSDSFSKRLLLPIGLLFVFGFLLVTVQSIVDVVFLLAMVEMGAQELGLLETIMAVTIYTVAALAIQVAVVVGYQVMPQARREGALGRFNDVLERRGELVAGVLMLVLGIVLLAMGATSLLRGTG